jgi:hypothetical protein
MAFARLSALAALAAALASASRPVSNVHLALSSDPTAMHVQWTSAQGDVLGSGDSTAQWGASPRALTQTAAGYNWSYTDPSTQRKYTFNAATMTGLTPGATVFYRVGSELDGWSAVNSFVATRAAAQFSEEAPLKIAWFGDLGWLYAQALPYLQTETAQGNFDHVGGCLRHGPRTLPSNAPEHPPNPVTHRTLSLSPPFSSPQCT